MGERMKGYYTCKLLNNKFYRSLIYSYMDKIIKRLNNSESYTQYIHQFNDEGEFVYRAIHTRQL